MDTILPAILGVLPQVREAVNAANFSFGPTIVMSVANDDGVIGIHLRRDKD